MIANVEFQESTQALGALEESGAVLDASFADFTGYEEGKAAGKQAEYDEFWDMFQNNGKRTDYRYAFRSAEPIWTETNFKPKYDFKPVNALYMFGNFKLGFPECLNGRVLDFSKTTTMNYCFANYTGKYLPSIDLTSCITTEGALGWCSYLTTIEKIITSENTPFASLLNNNTNLETVIFEGVIGKNGLNLSTSPKLTIESLRSIISCLKDYSQDTSGTQWAVTVGSANLAKLTDDDLDNIDMKGWVFK